MVGEQPPPDEFGFVSSGLPEGARLGSSVAVGSASIVVGVLNNGTGDTLFFGDRGSFPVQGTSLQPRARSDNDQLGTSVAMSGDRIVAGAPGGASNAGIVYVFDGPFDPLLGNRVEAARLTASDGAFGDQFGHSVAVDGDTAVVGARWDDDHGDRSGSAYIFVRSSGIWSEQEKLTPSDAGQAYDFGTSVSISGDTIVVGAPGASSGIPSKEAGAAYVFTRTGTDWTEQQKLELENPQRLGRFGDAVDIDGDTVVLGAKREDSGMGGAYFYIRDGAMWTLQARVIADDGGDQIEFGNAVAVSGDRAVIGAHWWEDTHRNSGAAYIFSRSGTAWTKVLRLLGEPEELSDFGASVDIKGSDVLVGAPGATDKSSGLKTGEAYLSIGVATKATVADKKPVEPLNRYIAYQADGGSDPAADSVTFPRNLYAPFSAELIAGVLDEGGTDGLAGAEFAIGVEASGSGSFYEVEATFTETGIDARAVTHEGPAGDPVSFDGATLLYVAVEHDGTDLILSARPRGSGSFTELARVADPASDLQPRLRVAGVPPGAKIGFDEPVLVNGEPPDDTARATEFLYQALELQLTAAAELDAQGDDPGTPLRDSQDRLADAVALLDTLRTAAKKAKKGPKPAWKQARRAAKKVRKALKKLGQGRPARVVDKQVQKAIKAELKALGALSP
jgi:hypothetical protein